MIKKHEVTIEAMVESVLAGHKDEVAAVVDDSGLTQLDAMYVFANVASHLTNHEVMVLANCLTDYTGRYLAIARIWIKRIDNGGVAEVFTALSQTTKRDAVIYLSVLEDFREGCAAKIAEECVRHYDRHEQSQEA